MVNSNPRFERRGGPPDLPAAFTEFVKGPLRGRSLDDEFDIESAGGQFPDFSVYRDLILIEMKHLETDQRGRIQAVLDDKIIPEERLEFYGQRRVDINGETFSNAEEIIKAITTKLNRSLEGLLSKSNRQFRSFRERHPRKNAINICVILNSSHADYTPEVVINAIHSKMKEPLEGGPRFESIDAVLYISEKHFIPLVDGRMAHPIAIYEGRGLLNNGWKIPIVERLIQGWSNFRTGSVPEFDGDIHNFGIVHDIPDRMTRSESWILEYEREPYYRELTLQQLRVQFNRTTAINALALKGRWPKHSTNETTEGLRRFAHLNTEINMRGIDISLMNPDLMTMEEREIVFSDLPNELVENLKRELEKRNMP